MSLETYLPLLITLDVERDYSPNWKTPPTLTFRSVLEAIPRRLAPLLAEFGVRPTYFLSPEVLMSPECVATLQAQPDCELAAHLHGEYLTPQVPNWNLCDPSLVVRAMQGEYAPELERAKLATLTELFRQQFGSRPQSFRAGHFGIGRSSGKFLQELGYLVDSSVSPHITWTSPSGAKFPDFQHAPEWPYTVGPEGDIWRPGKSRLLEVPLTILPATALPAQKTAQPVWFRPWYSDAETLCAVVDHVAAWPVRNGVRRPLVMMFHSEELVPGASPYPQTEADVTRYLDMLRRTLERAITAGAQSATLAEYHARFFQSTSPGIAPAANPINVMETRSPSAPVPLSPSLRLDPALIEPALDAHQVPGWFKYIFKERASRWDCWRPCFWIAEHVAKDAPILSLGTGVGFNLLWLAEQGFTHLHGSDLDPKAIAAGQQIAREANLPVHLWVDDALAPTQLPLEKFAVIEALNWTHLLENFSLEKLLDTYLPHLADGGAFIIDTIDPAYNQMPDNQYCTQDRNKPEAERRSSEYRTRFSEADIRGSFARHGLSIVDIIREPQVISKSVYIGRRVAVTEAVGVAPRQVAPFPVAEAEVLVRQALVENPNGIEALKLLVSICLDTARWAEAAKACFSILQQTPDDLDVLRALAHCLLQTGEVETAALVSKRIQELAAASLGGSSPVPGEPTSAGAVATVASAAPVSRRPHILLIADVPNWIFERHARTLHGLLGAEFDFTLGFQGQHFNEDDYDLIYPLEWNLVKREHIRNPRKWITGIRSHCSWDKEPVTALTERLRNDFQCVHVVSQRLLRLFAPHLPGVVCVSHGVDTRHFTPTTPADQSGHQLRLGWAGNRLSGSQKGFKDIIEPLGRLPGVELVFCGYNDRNLSLDQMREFYNSIDAYVCASDFEGNNNSLLEAAAMARAIISTDNGTVPEYLQHGESALIVERTWPAFVRAVEALRDDPALRLTLGQRARESAVAHWDWRRKAEDYRALFRASLAASGFPHRATPPPAPAIVSDHTPAELVLTPEQEDSIRAGLAAIDREDWPVALRHYQHALSLSAHHAELHRQVTQLEQLVVATSPSAQPAAEPRQDSRPSGLTAAALSTTTAQTSGSECPPSTHDNQVDAELRAAAQAIEALDWACARDHYRQAQALAKGQAVLTQIICEAIVCLDGLLHSTDAPAAAHAIQSAAKALPQSPSYSFCIITNGKRPEKLRREIESIRALGIPNYEILVSGDVPEGLDGVTVVPTVDAARSGRLGEMRNRLTEQARFDHLVVADDDLVFLPDFYDGLLRFGEDYDVQCVRFLNPDGTRYWDWATIGGPRGHALLPYEETDPHVYVTGGLCIMKAGVAGRVKWDEGLGYYEGEDTDFSSRLHTAGISIKFNSHCAVVHHDVRLTQFGEIVVSAEGLRQTAIAHLQQSHRAEAEKAFERLRLFKPEMADAISGIIHPVPVTRSVARPSSRTGHRPEPTVIGIDGRTFYLNDSTSRGIGHYAFHHLKHAAQLRPDWRFVLYIEEEKLTRPLERLIALPNLRVKLLDTYQAGEADLFHIPDPMNLTPGFDSPARLCPGLPNTAIFYDLTPLRFYWESWPETNRKAYLARLNQFHQRGTTMLAISEYTRQDLLSATKIGPERVFTIMAGLNQTEQQCPITPTLVREIKSKYGINKPFLLHVGALDPHKNFEAVIHSLGRVPTNDGVQLVVVGEKDHFLKAVAEHCEKLKLKHILFPGYIPRLDLEVLYQEAVALLFLSKYEGFGFPVLEAMAQGCPVITTNVTSIPEVAGDAALLFAPDDYTGIAQGIQRLISDRKLRQSLRPRGRDQAAKFPWEKPAQKTIAVWERLLSLASTGTPVAPLPSGEERRPNESPNGTAAPLCRAGDESASHPVPIASPRASDHQNPCDEVHSAVAREPIPPDRSATLPVSRNSPSAEAARGESPGLASSAATPDLVWYAPWQNPSGYGSEALTFARALASSVPLTLVDVGRIKSPGYLLGLPGPSQEFIQDHLQPSADATNRICLSHFPGSGFAPLPAAAWNIGRTMFETDRLPENWVTRCNQMDEIWVPSRFNLETFTQSGVERDKLHVIPGAVDPDEFDPAHHAPLPLPNRAACNFLAVFEWSLRKGWDVLIAAYLREFSAADDVCLYLRTYLVNQPDGDPTETVLRLIREHAATLNLGNKSWPRIEILAQQVPSADLPRLYRAVDCLVAPSRGEGWGRPHHEAMLMELPIIATHWSGNTEFMTADNSFPLDYQLVDVKSVEPESWHYHGHRWAEPSESHLRELMRKVQQDPAQAREIGRRARAHMRQRFGPKAVAALIQQRLVAIHQKLTTSTLPKLSLPVAPSSRAETGSPRPAVAVAWEGSFLDLGSLAHVNREFTRKLAGKSDIQLTCVGRNGLSGELAHLPVLQTAARGLKTQAPKQTQLTIRHAWPPNWAAPESGAWVLMQPWEFGVLPASWVESLARVDEVWAYSEYVRRVYVDSGAPPAKVKVVPLGIDPEQFHPQAKPTTLATAKSFKFLFVGGTIRRKGAEALLQSYLANFTALDDVCLVIKDFGGRGVYAGQTLEPQIQAAQAKPNAPQILYLNRELPPEALPGLYTACDCLVHPYRGEGFGLPVLEAMACGLPAIVTGGGATDDFASDEYAYRIPARRQAIGAEVGGLKLVKNGWWLEPDTQALADQMRWVVAHRPEAEAKGQAASQYVRREWTWARAARIATQRVHDLVARKRAEAETVLKRRARKAPPLILPPAARVGHLGPARDLLRRKELVSAWNAGLDALRVRPFHPEAWLLLAEIAQAAGDSGQARQCANQAANMAPKWRPARQFLKSPPKTGAAKVALPPLPQPPTAIPKPGLSLSVCLIARNEERFLDACLGSVRDLAQQIVVVDTGSTDRTIEIARQHGAEVHSFTWCDDFSAARNAALEHVTGDWVLVLDADEELIEAGRAALLQATQDSSAMGYRLPIVDKGREEEGCSYVPRLFRNAPGLFWVGRVHEQIFSSLEVRRQEWGLENKLGTATLLHHGYTNELTRDRNKIARNLRLLERAVEELPNEPNLLMSYGLELARAGQLEAGLVQYEEAFHVMSAQPASRVVPELRETLLTQMCTQLMAAQRFDDIITILQSPLARSGGLTASLHFSQGLALLEKNEASLAAEQFRQCVAKRNRPALAPVNKEIHKAGPNHCLALCLATLKQAAVAEEAFRAALADDPKSRPARFDYARFLNEQGKPVEALQLLHALATEKPDETLVWQLGGQIALSRPEFLEFACDWTGEAVKHAPQQTAILQQRAEALLLSQQPQAALPLWRQAHSPSQPRHVSALILCELLAGVTSRPLAPSAETAVSQEFLNWYRRLVQAGASTVVVQVNERLDRLANVLPSVTRVLTAVVKEADQAPAV